MPYLLDWDGHGTAAQSTVLTHAGAFMFSDFT